MNVATGAFGDNYTKSPKTEKCMKPNIRKAIWGCLSSLLIRTGHRSQRPCSDTVEMALSMWSAADDPG